ncbi:MAG: hypothetical protein LUD48_01465, partial [Prevotella sp.]|nr:hypothetical protein [Prevotella sp.]
MDHALYDELYHHGILGQKWGVRRYQNKDGSYTAAGRARYGIAGESNTYPGAISEYEPTRTNKNVVYSTSRSRYSGLSTDSSSTDSSMSKKEYRHHKEVIALEHALYDELY